MTYDEKYEQFSKLANECFFAGKTFYGQEKEIALIAFTEIQIHDGGLLAFVEHSSQNIRQEIYQIYEKIGAKDCLAILQEFQTLLDAEPKLCNLDETDERNDEYWDALDRICNLEKVTRLEESYWEISADCFILAYDYYIKPKDER